MNPTTAPRYDRIRCIGFALCLVAICLPTRLHAYESFVFGFCPAGIAWDEDATLHLHTTSFPNESMRAAVADPARTINEVGGQWFDIAVTTTDDKVGMYNGRSEAWGVDEMPLFHGDSSGLANMNIHIFDRCRIVESDIILNYGDVAWVPGVPSDYGDLYFADPTYVTIDGSDYAYMRSTVLHELLHFSGFAHEDDEYSMLNYRKFNPWQNTVDPANMLSPLPTDRAGLRATYPVAGETEGNLLVTTTWLGRDSENGANIQERLCLPSVGSIYVAVGTQPAAATYCALEPRDWCVGEPILTRFAVSNNGTQDTSASVRLYLSLDANLSSDDIVSPTTVSVPAVAAGTSVLVEGRFAVPEGLLPRELYYVIVKVRDDAGKDEESLQDNWIPLPGLGQGPYPAECTPPPPPSCTYDGTSDSCQALVGCDGAVCEEEFQGACNAVPPTNCASRVCCTTGTVSCCSDWIDEDF